MPQNMLADGLSWLTDTLVANAASEVRYARGADSVVVRAMFGNRLLKLEDGDGGVRMEWTDIDFLIRASDLELAGEAIEPRRGDLVYLTDAHGTSVYRVSPFGGDPAWRNCEPHGSMFRIHTKHVETEASC